jgi:hypothetical protein
MSIAAWPSIDPAVGLFSGRLDDPRPDEQPEQHREHHDHDRPPDELCSRELPAHQQRQDHAEFDDEVRRGDLERHRRGEVRALAKQRARQCDRGIRAR